MQSSFDRVETIFIELIGFQFYRTRPEISKIVTVYTDTRQICLEEEEENHFLLHHPTI